MNNPEPDDNTLDNAGPVGQRLADALTAHVIKGIEGMPLSEKPQRVAITRIVARNLDTYADEVES